MTILPEVSGGNQTKGKKIIYDDMFIAASDDIFIS